MMEAVDLVWDERAPDGSGSISLDTRGRIHLSLRAGYSWQVRPLNLGVFIPD